MSRAIERFTHHLTTCEKSITRMVSGKCTCGRDQALAELKKQSPVGDFTKILRDRYKNRTFFDATPTVLLEELMEACVIIDRQAERIQAMFVGDLSPESRLNGYKVITGKLTERRDKLLKENNRQAEDNKSQAAEIARLKKELGFNKCETCTLNPRPKYIGERND